VWQCIGLPHDLRKTRRRRGYRTHGWGIAGQHRRSGTRGGSGYSGKTDVKFMLYYGKIEKDKGFTRKGKIAHIVTLNLRELDEHKESIEDSKKGPVLNLSKLGYEKLLGSGQTSLKNLTIVVSSWTPKSEKKLLSNSCNLEKPAVQ
jgi:large subunit ribosomal protein L15